MNGWCRSRRSLLLSKQGVNGRVWRVGTSMYPLCARVKGLWHALAAWTDVAANAYSAKDCFCQKARSVRCIRQIGVWPWDLVDGTAMAWPTRPEEPTLVHAGVRWKRVYDLYCTGVRTSCNPADTRHKARCPVTLTFHHLCLEDRQQWTIRQHQRLW